MDLKEKEVLKYYKFRIENRLFDETDVYGFLIFIREHLTPNDKSLNKLNLICEMSNMIAHRERNQGNTIDYFIEVEKNVENLTELSSTTQKLNYTNFDLKQQLKVMFLQFNINVDSIIIDEVFICILSILQYIKLKTNNRVYIGELVPQLEIYNLNDKKSIIFKIIFKAVAGYKSEFLFHSLYQEINCKFLLQNEKEIIENRFPIRCIRKDGELILKNNKGIIFKGVKYD